MNKISEDKIELIRDTADIVDVISKYVDLKNRGNNFFGLCPFHNEKTPSFSVAAVKQIYYCFGCGKGGNVFSFIMDYQKISFPESLKILADQYNIKLDMNKNKSAPDLYSSLYKMHEVAENLYHRNLFSENGKTALKYLKNRGVKLDIIKKLKIGLSFNKWDQLVNKCKQSGFSINNFEKSGLFVKSKTGFFDRFRSRIMFPIKHLSGKTIGFGARIFDKNDPAKYLNSSESPIFKKSDILYGLDLSRNEILKNGYVILVEGYLDFIQLYQGNILPVVSVSGTAFSERHAIALKRVTKKVILLYDADSAGGNAIIKAGWIMLKMDLEPSIVRPPDGKDPDDWIREYGEESVKKSLEAPIDYSQFHIDFFNAKKLKGSDKQEYLINIVREIRDIKNGIIQNDLIRTFSQKLMVDEIDLLKLSKTIKRYKPVKIEKNKSENKFNFENQLDKAQIELIKLLCNNESHIREYALENISINHFLTPFLKKIASCLIKRDFQFNYSEIIEKFKIKEEREMVTRILFTDSADIIPEEIVSDCLKILISAPIKLKIKTLRSKIREKESKGEYPKIEILELDKYRDELNDF